MTRRIGHFLPAQVEFAECLRGGRQFRRLAGFFVRLERGNDRLGHRDQLFLLLGVGEPAPFVHVAQFLDLRRHGFLLCTQGRDRFRQFLGSVTAACFFQRRRHVAHQAFTFTQRHRFGFGHTFGAFGQPLQFGDHVETRLVGGFPSRRLTRLEGT